MNYFLQPFEISLLTLALLLMFSTVSLYLTPFGSPLYLFLFLLLAIYSQKVKIKKNIYTIISTILLLFILLYTPVVLKYKIFTYYIQLLIQIFFFLYFGSKIYKKKYIDLLIKCYVFSGVFISLCVILKGELYKGMAGRASYSLLTSKLLEVNYMATYISNTFVFSVYLLLRKHKIYYLAISLLVFVGLLLTGSRAAILGALLGIAVILYYFIGNKKKNKIFIFFLVIGFIVFFLIIASSFRARLFNFESYNDDSNRLRILHWIHALELIKKKPLLGYGPINTQIIFANELGMQGLSHNSYLGLLIQFGAFGFFIYLLIPFSMLLWGIKHKSGLLLGVIINICFTSLIIENQITMSFWIPMIILEMIINNINIRR